MSYEKLKDQLVRRFMAHFKVANFVQYGQYLMSEAAVEEFEGQSVFGTLDEFVAAMPGGIRGIHAIPLKVGARSLTANSPESEWFGEETFVTPTEEMLSDRQEIRDESIYRIDNPYDLPKTRSGPDVEDDNAEAGPASIYRVDDSTPDYSITDYPYRDGIEVPEEYNVGGKSANCGCGGDCGCGGECGGDCGCGGGEPKTELDLIKDQLVTAFLRGQR